MNLAHCIECGCHDLAACVNEDTGVPCSWLVVDRTACVGVCSACPEAVERWRKGDRACAVPVEHAGAWVEANEHPICALWVVYDSPSDFPGRFVARKWVHDKPTAETMEAGTLDDLRALLPTGMVSLQRSRQDDPKIVEIWI